MVFLLVAGGALAAPETPPASPSDAVEGELLIWSGAKTRAEAEAQRRGLDAYLKVLEPVLSSHPEVFESARIEGLKPGFFIVALGLCPKKEAAAPLAVFQGIYPDVYTRTVKFPASALPRPRCPEPQPAATNDDNLDVPWHLKQVERLTEGAHTLIGLAFTYDWSQAGDFARSYFDVQVLYLRVDKKRRLVGSEVYKGPSDATTLESFKAEGGRLISRVKYGDPPCDTVRDSFKGWSNRIQVSLSKTGIRLEAGTPELLEEGSCGYADESRMISGEGHSEEE